MIFITSNETIPSPYGHKMKFTAENDIQGSKEIFIIDTHFNNDEKEVMKIFIEAFIQQFNEYYRDDSYYLSVTAFLKHYWVQNYRVPDNQRLYHYYSLKRMNAKGRRLNVPFNFIIKETEKGLEGNFKLKLKFTSGVHFLKSMTITWRQNVTGLRNTIKEGLIDYFSKDPDHQSVLTLDGMDFSIPIDPHLETIFPNFDNDLVEVEYQFKYDGDILVSKLLKEIWVNSSDRVRESYHDLAVNLSSEEYD